MRALQAIALIPLLLLISCSGGMSSSSPNYTGPYVYLMSNATGNWQVSSYPATDTGNASAANTATVSTDPSVYALEISSDGSGNLYTVTDPVSGNGFTVTEYSTANGALAQKRTFSSLTGREGPMVADKSGVVYVSQIDHVVSFAANASGTATITQSYPVATSSSIEGMAEDALGNIYLGISSSSGSQTIEEFSAGFSSLTPVKTINLNQYLSSIVSVAVDSNGSVYGAGAGLPGIFGSTTYTQVYAVLAFDNGSLTPTRSLSNAYNSNLIGKVLNSVAVDSHDLLYVYSYVCPAACNNTVAVFSATATGNVTPLNYFQIASPLPILQSMAVD
jgi:hypothetical protein